jgi:hypothetical protein
VIVNLIVKAVTAPFSLLASLVGGSHDQPAASFSPGGELPHAAGEKTIEQIAAMLDKRPGLRVDVSGRADSWADASALRAHRLEMRLTAAKRAALIKSRPRDPEIGEVRVEPGERPGLLGQLWRELPSSRNAGTPDPR